MEFIEELEKHQKRRGYNFGSIENFEAWCDEVQPLLHFSQKHERVFEQAKSAALVTYRIGSKQDAVNNINEAIGIVNQAIVFGKTIKTASELEAGVQQESSGVAYPEKVTLLWLVKHVEVKHWLGAAVFIIAVFTAGIKVGNSAFYQDYFQAPSAIVETKTN